MSQVKSIQRGISRKYIQNASNSYEKVAHELPKNYKFFKKIRRDHSLLSNSSSSSEKNEQMITTAMLWKLNSLKKKQMLENRLVRFFEERPRKRNRYQNEEEILEKRNKSLLLPKVQKNEYKLPSFQTNLNEIGSNSLGILSMTEILRKREERMPRSVKKQIVNSSQMTENDDDLSRANALVTKKESIESISMQNLFSKEQKLFKKLEDQVQGFFVKDYSDYHIKLMEKNPVYKIRYFKMKHHNEK